MRNFNNKETHPILPLQREGIGILSDLWKERNVATSLFTLHTSLKRVAFTLAETLITLGIIGVVAAITMPALINKYRRFELENRFKKTSAVVENAVYATMHEFNMEDLLKGKTLAVIPNSERIEMNEVFIKQFSAAKPFVQRGNDNIPVYKFESGTRYSTGYSGTVCSSFATGYEDNKNNHCLVLPDGVIIGNMSFQYHGVYDGIKVYFDTNGAKKGPNRFGYDIFIYDTGYWQVNRCDDGIPYGCYKYAQRNENPQDTSKKYWDSLKF